MLYLPVCKPTAAKGETGDIVRIDMMAENLDWDPNDPTYSSQEAIMTDYRGVVLPCPDRGQPFVINALSYMTTDAADIINDENFGIVLPRLTPLRQHLVRFIPRPASQLIVRRLQNVG